MDKTVHNILSKLKTLSKVQSGQNLVIGSTHFDIYDCQKSQWERFIKWWLKEDRYKTANKLDGFYLEIKDVTTALLDDTERHQTNLQRLHKEMVEALEGLDNLKGTYQTDKTIVSQLETLKENFHLEITRLSRFTSQEETDPKSHNQTPNNQTSNPPLSPISESSQLTETESETEPEDQPNSQPNKDNYLRVNPINDIHKLHHI